MYKLREKIVCGGCTGTIVLFYIKLINHHTYIELSCYLIKTPTILRFSAIIIENKGKISSFFYCLPNFKIVMDPKTLIKMYIIFYEC